MAHVSTGVEYALHCLLFIADERQGNGARDGRGQPGTRDLAELQGVPAEFTAKLFTKLQKAGLVETVEGAHGGVRLARPADSITVDDVVLAIDGERALFECREIRARCAVFGGDAPGWATSGTCGIHAVMLRAHEAMRREMQATTLADLSLGLSRKAPASYGRDVDDWLEDRTANRIRKSQA